MRAARARSLRELPRRLAAVPKRLRKHFYSIYAFARTADDFADEGRDQPPSKGLRSFRRGASSYTWLMTARQATPYSLRCAKPDRLFDLPISLFDDLLSAFSQDVVIQRYESFDQLLDYCRRSANPVGRLILLLFGYSEAEMHERSDDICTALQLANHWQDVAVDLEKERVYLPAEDLDRFGVTIDELKTGLPKADLQKVDESSRSTARASYFIRGKPLCGDFGGRLGLELRAVWLGGWRILDRIEENGYDVFTRRPVITRSDKLRMILGAFRKGDFRARLDDD